MSYSRDDLARVKALVRTLREQGFDVWWDQNIAPNALWADTIDEELRAARVVIAAWSPAAISSENVKEEARWAKDRGKLLQVFVRPCRPPVFFGERQGINLTDWFDTGDGTGLELIVQYVRSHLRGEGGTSGVEITVEIMRLLSQIRKKCMLGENGDWFGVVPLTKSKGIRAGARIVNERVPIRLGLHVKLVFELKEATRVGVITIDGGGIVCLDDHLGKERKLFLPRGTTEFVGHGSEPLAVHLPLGDAATVAFAVVGPLEEQIAALLELDPITPQALLELLQRIIGSRQEESVICPCLYSVVE